MNIKLLVSMELLEKILVCFGYRPSLYIILPLGVLVDNFDTIPVRVCVVILTYRYKDDPLTERINIFSMAIDSLRSYSNEAERTNRNIDDDFKLK